MNKIHEIKNSGIIIIKFTDLVDSSFSFNEIAIESIKRYAKEELSIELNRILLKTNIDCDLLTNESRPTGSHSSNSDHNLKIFKTHEGEYIAELSLSEVIRIEQL